MKNLRKVLAVVLVVALAFSLCSIAGAAQIGSYSDASSVKYTEAVDLVTGLGIMTGSDSTTFNPTGTFTREMAAKVICYVLLGNTVASSLSTTTSSFSDVASSRWSAPFIQYCAAAGIINGDGTGKFNPEAAVTGTQFAKLLLTALGYGAKGEFTGANWELNSLVKAQALGILTTGVNYTAAATRQEVAQYVFNALTACYPVTYNTVLGTYGNTLTDMSYVNANNGIFGKETLGYSAYQLLQVSTPMSYYGLTAHYWTAYNTTVPATVSGTYADDTVLYTSSIGAPFNIANLTTANSGFYGVSLDYGRMVGGVDVGVYVYVNGVKEAGSFTSAAALAADASNTLSGQPGVVLKFLDNDKNGLAESIYIYQYSASTMTVAPTTDSAGNVTFTAPGISGTYAKTSIVIPSGFNTNDYFTYILWANNGVLYVQKATPVTGSVTGSTVVAGGVVQYALTIGGKSYTIAGYASAANFLNALSSGSNNYNIPVTAWVDQNGYLIYCQATTASSYNYGLVLAYVYNPAGLGSVTSSAQVELMKNDGTIGTYWIAVDPTTGVVPDQTTTTFNTAYGVAAISRTLAQQSTVGFGPIDVPGTLVSYAFDGNNNAMIKNVNVLSNGLAGPTTSGAYAAAQSYISINAGINKYLTGTAFGAGNYYINSATKVFYYSGVAYQNQTATPASVVTGAGSTQAEAAGKTVAIVTDPNSPTLLDAIYIKDAGPIGTSGNYIFFNSNMYTLNVVNGVNSYVYPAFINGATTPTNVTSTTDLTTTINGGGAFAYTTSGNNDITSLTPLNAPTTGYTFETAYKVTYVGSGIIGYNDNNGTGNNLSINTDSNTKYFQFNTNTLAVTATPITQSVTGGVVRIMSVVMNGQSDNAASYVYFTVSAT